MRRSDDIRAARDRIDDFLLGYFSPTKKAHLMELIDDLVDALFEYKKPESITLVQNPSPSKVEIPWKKDIEDLKWSSNIWQASVKGAHARIDRNDQEMKNKIVNVHLSIDRQSERITEVEKRIEEAKKEVMAELFKERIAHQKDMNHCRNEEHLLNNRVDIHAGRLARLEEMLAQINTKLESICG